MGATATGDTVGFAKLPNALLERGILAHIRPQALKVYLAILHATRTKTVTCWPGVETLARWSGVPRSRVSGQTAYLEQHRLLLKGWIKIKGNPRRTYRVTQPTDSMYPDYRESCSVCTITDDRRSCVVRDKATGRLLGKRRRVKSPNHRDPGITDHRDSPMITDDRDTKQIGADEEIGSRRGGGVGEPGGALRSAPPLEAASLRAPALGGEPTGEPKAASKGAAESRRAEIRMLLDTFSGDRRLTRTFALKAGRSESEIAEALGEESEPTTEVDRHRRCEAVTRAGLACVGRPVVGSRFCKRHQTRRDPACAPVG